jgi:isopenicillin N synthase-like dioxygenase
MDSVGVKRPADWNLQSKTFFELEMHEKETYLAGRSGSGYTKLLSQALGEGRRDHKE